MNENSETEIFINKPEILIDTKYLKNFIPNKGTTIERLNATVRFAAYLSIALTLVKGDYRYLYLGVSVAGIIYFFYQNNVEKFTSRCELKRDHSNRNLVDNNSNNLKNETSCQEPTPDNPFMNTLLTDNFSEKKAACKYTSEINKKVNDIYHDKLFMDQDLVYNSDFSSRQFYTMPNSKVPNDQDVFASWLYTTPGSCSAGNEVLYRQAKTCGIENKNIDKIDTMYSDFNL